MQDFIPGQRWINDAELHLGLGTVVASEHRTVSIAFLASGETRNYAKQSAPLTRAIFSKGDSVQSHDGLTIVIDSVHEDAGLLTYVGKDESGRPASIEEGQLDNFIQLNKPGERLLTGQIDQDKWFELRYQTLQQFNRLTHSTLTGLTGCRTSLIPHQLYIAHEVAGRFAPRVLLADEVGLGKTIEAGLILHQQLLTERAQRILIVVPESLLHQWLVEMLRRFNLQFSLFDEDRYSSLKEFNPEQNPFHSEQLVLCSLSFLSTDNERFAEAIEGEWDLLIVDEAHHLEWTEEKPSRQYRIIEQLAEATAGVLLLTATPEQLGKAGHYARLRLLDPERFPSFEQFIEEEQAYEPVAHAVEQLLTQQALDEKTIRILSQAAEQEGEQSLLDNYLQAQTDKEEKLHWQNQLIAHLVDRHGTGRVLFRNTRLTIKGFPQRKAYPYPLPLPPEYEGVELDTLDDIQQLLSPEQLLRTHKQTAGMHWTQFDPRVNWLIKKLTALKPNKVLVILSNAQSALELAEALRLREGIHAAVFHEGLKIVERDRAAAHFADMEDGGQVLICSEIGSEGRNFQFAHQLILFDIPINPDLLEQRIGRLDRIGQTQTIDIHLPYLENHAQALMFRWYHEALNAFEQCCPAGQTVYTELATDLHALLQNTTEENTDALIVQAKRRHAELNEKLHKGRDRLLEYNSCRPELAASLLSQALEEDKTSVLPAYMENIFDCFGVSNEEHSQGNYILRPGEDMLTAFPRLPDDGMTITYSRETALANEDIHYLTWDHPMVTGAMDIVLTSELGNTAVTAIEYPELKAGSLLLECIFLLESASSHQLHTNRYLPATTIRIVLDENGKDHSDSLGHDKIRLGKTFVDKDTSRQIVQLKADTIRNLIERSEQRAQQQVPELLSRAQEYAKDLLEGEMKRLHSLARINANVRSGEIAFFETQLQQVNQILDSASMRLDALRIMIAT